MIFTVFQKNTVTSTSTEAVITVKMITVTVKTLMQTQIPPLPLFRLLHRTELTVLPAVTVPIIPVIIPVATIPIIPVIIPVVTTPITPVIIPVVTTQAVMTAAAITPAMMTVETPEMILAAMAIL